MKLLAGSTAAALLPLPRLAAGAPAAAPVVVELFTSQGCSSCPPADAYLRELSKRDDVLALSLPVDYWDYLGWKDTFASPAYTRRQKAYAEALGLRNVYTPQMVIGGMKDAVGSQKRAVEAAIQACKESLAAETVPLTFKKENSMICVEAAAGNPAPATLWFITYQKKGTVEIKRGENKGRDLTYTNIVRDMTPLSSWNGSTLRIELPAKSLAATGYDGCAALLQEDGQGRILGAAKFEMS
ncbi:DUF1223 domain-containing protein [Tepidicaulis sp. LMO-SS28]|uniref:DUF1223 domain-containing protein n=1 Tax=Tepidicaulis sp. LMO-SS28 TaxID=3447455 RepID=UPI003EE03E57